MPESRFFEYKRLLNDRFERSVVAFLNCGTGGIIYVGINDDGTIIGVENPDETQKQIADRIKNNIAPETLGLYDIILEQTGDINPLFYIKVIVSSGTEKPYYIRSKGMTPDGCFIRVGSQTQSLTPQMIEHLFARRTRNNLRVIEAPRQDLTFNQLRIYYEEHGKFLTSEFAKTLEFYTPEGKYNVLAYLLADENGVSIKVAKYAGTNKVNLIENEEMGYCSLLKATDRVLEKLRIENKTFTKITDKFRVERQMYDSVAMREAVINAFVHNDYTDLMTPVFELFSDRLEITSYGGLIDGMTQSELTNGISRPRSRELMRVFKDCEFVEQLGSGMNRMMSVYEPSIFHITPNFFHVILFFPEAKSENDRINESGDRINDRASDRINLSESEKSVLVEIIKNPFVKTEELVNLLGISMPTVNRSIRSLRLKGIMERDGSKKKGLWIVKTDDRINESGDRINDRASDRINLSESEKSVLVEIIKNPFVKTEELVSLLGISMPTVNRSIRSLSEKGVIKREGSKKTGHWIVVI